MLSDASPARAFRVCHLSDLHLPLREAARPWELPNKRALGWLNLKLNRGRAHRLEVLEGLLAGIAGERADLHVITGDLSSLALPREHADVAALLGRLGLGPDNTVLLPGNHDRYTISADLGGAFERAFRDYFEGDLGRVRDYPRTRVLGPIAFAALDTAVWRGPIRAAGRLDAAQAERLAAFLESAAVEDRWPVVAMHHPPYPLAGEMARQYRVGLAGHALLARALAGRRGTILHGHLHVLARRQVGGFDAIGVPSASHDAGEPDRQAAYHVYAFDRAGLLDAYAVRYWPDAAGGRRETALLPAETPPR